MPDQIDPWQKPEVQPDLAHQQSRPSEASEQPSLSRLMENIKRWRLAAPALRIATTLLTTLLVLLIVWVMDTFYLQTPTIESGIALSAANSETLPIEEQVLLAPQFTLESNPSENLARKAKLHTILPIRQSRYDVIQYTVEVGDTIFSIAEKFNLIPETILWGNRYTIGYNPHLIMPGQTLNILPVDGVYHRWSAGEGLNGIATVYGVTPEDIINWPGNELDPEELGDFANPDIPDNKMLVIPGGLGSYPDFSLPRISRTEPATAQVLGAGACTGSFEGISGTLIFLWPTTERYISGYDYSPATNHWGIDIGGAQGNPVYASDSGVVVYAGWNDYGYGEMIVIDHGFGWQTLYAHLSQVSVTCGQEVFKGDTIGLIGSTGESSGPHLHFEMRSDDYGRVNPWDFLN